MNGLAKRHCDTEGCLIWFLAKQNQRFCTDCARKRKLMQNKDSVRLQRGDPFTDMSPAMIDAIFAKALQDIRKSGVHRVEAASFDYRNRYREP